ncbi:MAG TPA: response regulator [Cyclobacteriaceae bacterium]
MTNSKILLVEDTILSQMVVKKCLANRGIEVTIANNGKEALELIRNKDFQIVLMDLHMPEMDGYESTSKIRAMDDSYYKSVPIILFSATSVLDAKEKANARTLGITDFMSKPILFDELDCLIHTYIEKKSDHRPLRVNFENFADNDYEFKQELIKLMINDIRELQQSFDIATIKNNYEIYRNMCQRMEGTINMLNDKEFTDTIDALKCKPQSLEKNGIVTLFNKLSNAIIESLTRESKMIKPVAEY